MKHPRANSSTAALLIIAAVCACLAYAEDSSPSLLLVFVLVAGIAVALARSTRTRTQVIDGTVKSVTDGDTVVIAAPDGSGATIRIRLAGIDAPEKSKPWLSLPGQPFGHVSADYLKGLCLGKSVVIRVVGTDDYGRCVGIISVGDLEVNLAMVSAGYAEVLADFLSLSDRVRYLGAQRKARAARVGMWAQGAAYVSPYDFRSYYQ